MKRSTEKEVCPQEIPAHFPVKAPEYYNFGYDVVDEWARRDRNKLAMIWANQRGEEKRFTFHDMSKLSNQAANLLIKLGITAGDRVFIMLPRLPEWWIFSLALIKLGAVQCPSPTLLTSQDIQHRIRYGKFKMVITDSENAHKFDEIYDDCPSLGIRLLVDGERPNWISYHAEIAGPNSTLSRHAVKSPVKIRTRSSAPMLLIFTSGTSKYPKMVMHNFAYPLGHQITAELWHNLKPNDLHMTVSDTGWGKNLWGNYFGQWIIGVCLFIYDIRGKFHADELLPLIEKYELTSFCAPPTVYRMMTLNDIGPLRLHRTARMHHRRRTDADRDDPPLEGEHRAHHPRSLRADRNRLHDRHLPLGEAETGFDGRPRTRLESGNPRRRGQTGQAGGRRQDRSEDLRRRPPGGSLRQVPLQRAGKTRPASSGISTTYTYIYWTGAYQDEDGYFWFVGRTDDIIKSSGYRIGPSEVEDVISHHPAVLEVAVVGAPDPLRGARVKAYIVLRPEFEATESLVREIQTFVKKETAPYKYRGKSSSSGRCRNLLRQNQARRSPPPTPKPGKAGSTESRPGPPPAGESGVEAPVREELTAVSDAANAAHRCWKR